MNLLPFILFLGSLILSKIIVDSAATKLDETKQIELIMILYRESTWKNGIIISILIIYFAGVQIKYLPPILNGLLYLITLLAIILTSLLKMQKKFILNNFPASYIQSYLFSQSILSVGLFSFFITSLFPSFFKL